MINKTSKSGSETTISLNSITDELKGIHTADDKQPNSLRGLSSNPGGAIPLGSLNKIKKPFSFCHALKGVVCLELLDLKNFQFLMAFKNPTFEDS